MQRGLKIKPVRGVVCRGLDTTSQVGWGKKKTSWGVHISWFVGGLSEGGGGFRVRKTEKKKT